MKFVSRTSALAALAAIASIAALGAASATGQPAHATSAGVLHVKLPADVAKSHTLKVSTFVQYPPYESQSSSGKFYGLDVDLLGAIAKELGLKYQIQSTAFESEIPGVADGRYDMMLGDDQDTAAREQVVSFFDWEKIGEYTLVRRGNPNHINTSAMCGITIGGVSASIQAVYDTDLASACAQYHRPTVTTVTYASTAQLFEALATGRIDAAFYDPAAAAYVVKQSPAIGLLKTKISQVPAIYTGEAGWPMPKNQILAKAFVAAAKVLQKNGTWQKILRRYGIVNVALKTLEINGRPVH
jgi:polar amino acid transport system substrate-binding protein